MECDIKYKFGTDGLRGKSIDYINNMLAFRLANSLRVLNKSKCVIGYDTRINSKTICYQIASGASEVGIDSEILGVCDSGCVVFTSSLYNCIGIMISASHNPYYDNGIKVIVNGEKLNGESLKLLEDLINNFKYEKASTFGKIIDTYNINPYLYYLKKHKDNCKIDYKVVIDNSNGANSNISRHIYNDLFRDCIYINDSPNGYNINQNCGCLYPNNTIRLLNDLNYDLGFLFDGDADRLIVCDKTRIYNGDEIAYVISLYLKEINKLNDNTIVLTKQSNLGVIKSLKEKNIDVLVCDVGDKNVYEAMKNNALSLGAEQSGHIIINEALSSGCGIISSLYLLKALNYFKKSLKKLLKDLKVYPEVSVNISVNKESDKDVCDNIMILNEIKKDLKKYDDSKIIIRKSGTENVIRLQISNKDINVCDYLLNKYTSSIKGLLKYE